MNPLQQFYQNEVQREAIHALMIDTLGEVAKELAFEGKDVTHIKDAKDCLEKMFDTLQERYGIIKTPINISSR